MHEKLKELTEKLYMEGVEKGREEADRILGEAKEKSGAILREAKRESDEILQEAEKKSAEMLRNARAEIKLAFGQAMNALKQDIESLITTGVSDKPVKEMFNDDAFVHQLIRQMVENWSPEKAGMEMDVFLPEDKVELAGEYFRQRAEQLMKQGLTLKPSEKLNRGFEISPKNGGFKISVTDEDLESFLKSFIRPGLKKWLYEENGNEG